MGHLTLVRHGQASFFSADYDELSATGVRQGRALGEHWARHGVHFDVAYVGPRRRHRQTLDAVAAVYREQGLPWPEAVVVPELDEHDGLTVIAHVLRANGTIGGNVVPHDPGEADRERVLREYFRHYFEIMRDWSRGTLAVPDVEGWPEFRARTLRALDAMCHHPGRGVAFTSGGTVSSAAGWLLGLDDERVIELSAVVRNTALMEVRHSGQRRGLVSFNAVPHLPDPRAVTSV
jgi:broad specificity phosphatase PhoE